MFDKLIESDTAGAEFKNRSRYFMVSTVVVGILFVTAVVYSLYAAEVGLGSGGFEISELVSPLVETKPEIPEQVDQSNRQQFSQSELPVSTSNIARPDEFQFVPDKPSSTPSNIPSRPIGKYILDPNGTNSSGAGGPAGPRTGRPDGTTSASDPKDTDDSESKNADPPPVIKATQSKPQTVSEGVINGKAIYLPIPAYPLPAKAVNAQGSVNVQVTINENGKVISAKAVTGNPLLRVAAEKAAWSAKFSTTYLSRVPVKVTGVIVYNFTRN
jgi:periplasmic protein TonB